MSRNKVKFAFEVIVVNPSYSVEQKSANDNAQNNYYPHLENRISQTYAAETNAKLKQAFTTAISRHFDLLLGAVGKLKVNKTSSKYNEIPKAKSQFVVARGNVTIIFNALKKPFDDVALFVQF